jgi:hypothetical protein
MFCLYVQPGASGGPVGHPVLVGKGTTHDVVVRGGGLVIGGPVSPFPPFF